MKVRVEEFWRRLDSLRHDTKVKDDLNNDDLNN
jgi:hypothetical protein